MLAKGPVIASATSRLGARLAVERRLVHPGRGQQRAEDERQHADDEGVAGRSEPPPVVTEAGCRACGPFPATGAMARSAIRT